MCAKAREEIDGSLSKSEAITLACATADVVDLMREVLPAAVAMALSLSQLELKCKCGRPGCTAAEDASKLAKLFLSKHQPF